VVEGARLESVFRGNSNEGSNPSLSAILESATYRQQQHPAERQADSRSGEFEERDGGTPGRTRRKYALFG
jgi:hypothetical protein